MLRNRVASAAVALSLVLYPASGGLAQEATTSPDQAGDTSPEDVRWDLVAHADGDELTGAPWAVEATLVLDDGVATGSSGCAPFEAGYTLDGTSLSFEAQITTSLDDCPADQDALADAYLGALAGVTAWAVEDGSLSLSSAEGAPLLVFEQPTLSLTTSDMAAITAELEALADEAADLRAARKKDRATIKTLRGRLTTLQKRVETLRARAAAKSAPAVTLNAAERVLLKGVPADIAGTCEPRRSDNPSGTVAALQCKPRADVVRDMAYYLMELGAAQKVFDQRVRDNIGSNGNFGVCAKGKPAFSVAVPFGGEACYRNADGRANLRIVQGAGDCRQVVAGPTTVRKPAIYIAVLGESGNIKQLAKWADGRRLAKQIRQPGAKRSNMCPW